MELLVESRHDDIVLTSQDHLGSARTPPADASNRRRAQALPSVSMERLLDRMLDLAREVGYREAQQAVVQERIMQLEDNLVRLTEVITRLQGSVEGVDPQPAAEQRLAVAELGDQRQAEAGPPTSAVEQERPAPDPLVRRARFERIQLKPLEPATQPPTLVSDPTSPRRIRWAWPRLRWSAGRAYSGRLKPAV